MTGAILTCAESTGAFRNWSGRILMMVFINAPFARVYEIRCGIQMYEYVVRRSTLFCVEMIML